MSSKEMEATEVQPLSVINKIASFCHATQSVCNTTTEYESLFDVRRKAIKIYMKYQFTNRNEEPCNLVHDENQIAESMRPVSFIF